MFPVYSLPDFTKSALAANCRGGPPGAPRTESEQSTMSQGGSQLSLIIDAAERWANETDEHSVEEHAGQVSCDERVESAVVEQGNNDLAVFSALAVTDERGEMGDLLKALPDDAFLQIIAACGNTDTDEPPFFEAVKGLGCLSKGMLQQLHRLQPLVGVRSLAVVQRPAHGPWRVTLQDRGAPLPVALSLACIGCFRLPSDMDDGREKHSICDKCRDLKLPTTYLCGVNCPANPGAWQLHGVFHKKLRKQRKMSEDGGAVQRQNRETADREARRAAESGDAYDKLMAEGARYAGEMDWRKAAKSNREAIALRPDEPTAYYNLGNALQCSGHKVEAAQRYLESKERYPVGSEYWAEATACAFDMLMQEECNEVAKPEWWNDEELKALSARVVRAAPNAARTHCMRAKALTGACRAWEAGPRSAAELVEAATHFDRCAALTNAPVAKVQKARAAGWCRSQAEAMK